MRNTPYFLSSLNELNDQHLDVDFPWWVGSKEIELPIGGMMGTILAEYFYVLQSGLNLKRGSSNG